MFQEQTFKLGIAGIPAQGLDLALTLEPRWFEQWREEDPSLDFNAPEGLTLKLLVQKHGRDLLLRGSLGGTLDFACSRCLTRFGLAVEGAFDLLLVPGPAPVSGREEELSADDLSLDYYTGDELDLGAIIKEQILLLIPLKPLCAEDCSGLCPRCGADLNRGACACPAEESTSPFAVPARTEKS
ncbi:MAG: DUF177 domain-containing protein [Deltaproteobacteria bacterium]|nr:DUF177 domain-containing protein [Deltaproteobacteria bacterium]